MSEATVSGAKNPEPGTWHNSEGWLVAPDGTKWWPDAALHGHRFAEGDERHASWKRQALSTGATA